tara:strand:- start:11742 stop:13010 length:1269 start_codon:yes stop_codon:yes gene_type:complete
MISSNQEEKELKDKLAQLEKKYKSNLFEEPEIPLSEPLETPELLEIPKPSDIPESIETPELPELPKEEKPKKEKSEKEKQVSKQEKIKNKPERIENKKISKVSPVEIKKSAENIKKIKKEMAKVLVGQEEIVNALIMGLLCNSHVLLEGVPGIAKTLAIRALGAASGCTVKRIQFTVDMLPTDIIGVTNYTPEKGFEIIKGPIFANFLIADEINRAPPKTQSALIEGMQEKQVTIGRKKFHLPDPFFVMATENPIENSGVYPLPEAQIDRFLFKVIMGYPEPEEEKVVMGSNITIKKFEDFGLKAVITPKDILKMQEIVRKVYVDENIKNYILAIVRKTREKGFENAEYISYGSSPRASIGIFLASKANALMKGRDYVLPEDVKKVVSDILRHRLILSYKASIQKISPEIIIREILNSIKVE